MSWAWRRLHSTNTVNSIVNGYVQVTNSPKKRLSLLASVLSYRSGWSLERDFHLLKDDPLGIRPLFVKSDAQIGGLVRLITLALRMLSVVEMQGRRGVAATGHKVKGYYSGNREDRQIAQVGSAFWKR